MKTIDGSSKIRFVVLMALSFIMIILCYIYHNYSVYKSIKVVVDDTAAIEYGSANYDIKNILKEVEGEVVSIKKDIDTNVLGEQEVILEVKKHNIIKDVPIIVSVVDTVAPIIKINNDSISITEGENFDVLSNITSVSDAIDGDLSYLENNDDNKTNFYTYSSDDLSSVGVHEVTIKAVDKAGNVSTSTFTVNVEAKPVVVQRVSYDAPLNASGNDIASIAYRYIGYPYVSGANGPYAFDCSGFVQYVYSLAGISVSRSTSTQLVEGTAVSYENAQPGDILSWGYVDGAATHSAIYVGNGQMIHATNPRQGVLLSDVAAWTRGSGTHVISVRRIG